jgi:predicted short-subunit dehydrogenase-like oxidoreductase (DUF2520 family)
MIKIIIIGTGNVGSHLCRCIESNSRTSKLLLVGYYNRAQKELSGINTTLIPDFDNLPECDLILLAVPDDSIEKVSQEIRSSQTIVAHTSGSVAMKALQNHKHHGVLYMPQSFSKLREPNFEDITICLESNTAAVNQVLEMVAVTLSQKQEQVNSEQRKKLHLAAVYMNNFVNHCYSKAGEIMREASMDSHLLDALMRETLEKAIDLSPINSQTGPAIRSDLKTIEKHLKMLKKEDREMYRSITTSIQKTHGNKL